MTEGCTYILNLKLLEHVEDISSRNFLRCLYEELGTLFLKMTSISIDQPTTAPAFPFVCQVMLSSVNYSVKIVLQGIKDPF